MAGYQGNFLEVDLTQRRHKVTLLDMDVGRQFLGGRGLGARLCGSGFRPVPIR